MREFYTASGVRLRRRVQRTGDLNWLFLPGGPGIGSDSLHELMDALDVPGALWGVDLPGDGSNVAAPGAPADPYSIWPGVLVEAARALPNPVFIGHSTGGMYLLSCPELEHLLRGLVLISTAPNAEWQPRFVEMTLRHPLSEVDRTSGLYEADPSPDRLRDVAVASAEWNFTAKSLRTGRDLLSRMPYRPEAVAWSDLNFDSTYAAAWWPSELPTLILSGSEDRIVDQSLWDDPRYQRSNISRRTILGGAHFPWIEDSRAAKDVFREFAAIIHPS